MRKGECRGVRSAGEVVHANAVREEGVAVTVGKTSDGRGGGRRAERRGGDVGCGNGLLKGIGALVKAKRDIELRPAVPLPKSYHSPDLNLAILENGSLKISRLWSTLVTAMCVARGW